MAHAKVSINRKWYGKIPRDRNGRPIPRNLWPKRRKYSWEVRWYSSEGKRYSKSFRDRKEAEKLARPRSISTSGRRRAARIVTRTRNKH